MDKRFKLIIEYDGTGYQGWQRQPNGPTVQAEIEAAIAIMTHQNIKVIGSGRTDAGVHALGQVAHFACDTRITPQEFRSGLNALLADDIVVRACTQTSQHFHARYDVKSKIYRYTIRNHPIPSAMGRHYEWWIKAPLNMGAMQAAAAYLVGEKDFKAFESTGSPRSHTVRHVMQADLQTDPADRIIFTIEANGFLRYMVRSIVGTLVEVGKDNLSPERFGTIVSLCDRSQAGATAPPLGLCLHQVNY